MTIIAWLGRVFGRTGEGAAADAILGLHLPGGAGPATAIIDTDELVAEIARARRYEHDLSGVVLAARPIRIGSRTNGNGSGEAQSGESKMPQVLALLTAVALREVVRCSDVVCYQAADNRFILGLTESDDVGAHAALTRIGEHFRSRLRLGVRAGVATFPSDAYTLEELVSTAAGRLAAPPPRPSNLDPDCLRARNGERRHGGQTQHAAPMARRDEA